MYWKLYYTEDTSKTDIQTISGDLKKPYNSFVKTLKGDVQSVPII